MEPDRLDVKFGYSCNNNCVHCVIADHRRRLRREGKPIDRSTQEMKEIIKNASERDITGITFTGGEVTIRDDFFELLKFAKSLDFSVGLQSNGRAFHRKEFAEKALEIAPQMHFEIAIHHSNPEVHDRITRTEGSAKQTREGIRNLKDLGAEQIHFKVVLSELNYEDQANIVKMADDFGIEQVDVAYPHGQGNAWKNRDRVLVPYSKIKKHVLEAIRTANNHGIETTYEAIPYCFLQGYEKHVSELNYLEDWLRGRTEELMQLGDPTTDWQKNRLEIKSKPESCKKCKYYPICEGPWSEYIDLHGSEELEPVQGEKIQTWNQVQEMLGESK